MSTTPTTVRYPLKDIKYLYINDRKRKCTYWLYPSINSGFAKLADVFHKFLPTATVGKDPVYHQFLRRANTLQTLGYVKLSKGKSGDMGEQPGIWITPTEQLFALISRVQNSNRFLKGAKSRREMQEIREKCGFDLAKLKMQRRKCPYFVSVRTRRDRMDAIFSLRRIRRHSMFKRRDKREINPELTQALEPVQSSFEKYREGIEGLQITLQHKETGAIKFLDYQTRFTDQTRQDGTIARYHRVWGKASEGFNTGVLLTLTSYPPSDTSKHQYRSSLWHADRHFGPAWNAFMSKLTKRNRAARRDELLDLKRKEITRTRTAHVHQERCWRCDGTGHLKGVTKKTQLRTCPRCGGKGTILKASLTKAERTAALLPMSKEWLCDQKLIEVQKTCPDRQHLTEDEIAAAAAPANFRPQYLQVYEFQKNGLLHSHVAIFGKSYLAYWEDIALDWMMTGQGERIHVYGIQRDGDRWVWAKEQPKDARNRQPVDYLGKYLGKGVRTRSGHGLYWTINKRFFTNSRALNEDRELPAQLETIESHYTFIGTTRNDEIPVWLQMIHRGKVRHGFIDALGWDPGGAAA